MDRSIPRVALGIALGAVVLAAPPPDDGLDIDWYRIDVEGGRHAARHAGAAVDPHGRGLGTGRGAGRSAHPADLTWALAPAVINSGPRKGRERRGIPGGGPQPAAGGLLAVPPGAGHRSRLSRRRRPDGQLAAEDCRRPPRALWFHSTPFRQSPSRPLGRRDDAPSKYGSASASRRSRIWPRWEHSLRRPQPPSNQPPATSAPRVFSSHDSPHSSAQLSLSPVRRRAP